MNLADVANAGRAVARIRAGGETAGAVLAAIAWEGNRATSVRMGDLARAIGQPYNAVWRAVRRLEELGIILVSQLDAGTHAFVLADGAPQ